MTVWRRAKGSKGHPLQSSWNLLSHRRGAQLDWNEISSSLPWLLCQLAPVPLWSGQKQQPTSRLSDVLHLAGSPASSRRGAIRYGFLSFEPLLSSLGLTFAPSSSRYSQTSLVHTAGGEWRCQTILVATHSFPKNWNGWWQTNTVVGKWNGESWLGLNTFATHGFSQFDPGSQCPLAAAFIRAFSPRSVE